MVEGAPRENAGFVAASPPAVGAAPAPKSGLFALPAAVVGVVDSAGLFAPPNRPPAPPGAGVVDCAAPNIGLGGPVVAPAPKRPPDACAWVVEGVVDEGAAEEVGVVDEPVFPPKRLPGGLDPGGGPAGVVEVLPNIDPPAGPGVVDEPPPNRLPPAGLLAPPPNIPPAAGCAGVVDPGVEALLPNKELD